MQYRFVMMVGGWLAFIGHGQQAQAATPLEGDSWSCQAFCEYYPDPGPSPVVIPYPRPFNTESIASTGSTAAEAFQNLTLSCQNLQALKGDPNATGFAVVDQYGNAPVMRNVCLRN